MCTSISQRAATTSLSHRVGRIGIGEEWSGSNDGKSDGAESDRVESEFVESVEPVENDGRQAGSDNFESAFPDLESDNAERKRALGGATRDNRDCDGETGVILENIFCS